MTGFVLMHRDILEWEWYQSPNVARLYIHLLLKANFKDKRWQGHRVRRGQLICSSNRLATELMISIQSVRTALSKLKESGYINVSSTNKFTLITIVNYDKTQSSDSNSNKSSNILITNQKQLSNTRITTTKESNKDYKINKETIEVRSISFKKQVFEHSNYDIQLLNSFYEYWSEQNKSKSKMRFEKDEFFNIKKRLAKWEANEKPKFINDKKESNLLTNR
ncbi:hypothetical protein [uncultured Winogradskyella sp.]|uniref:hypothetical protein n=1 Tax=uncultured Winogradskyella sp. TaxID=395353 RepID=UPI002630DECB|nr:hypothetical protein [uncultured Winogradskyella sp.]